MLTTAHLSTQCLMQITKLGYCPRAMQRLPISVVARRRAIAVGLVTQSWRGWATDLLKSTAIGSGLAALAGGVVVAATERWPRSWWLPVAGGSVAAGALFAALGPVL